MAVCLGCYMPTPECFCYRINRSAPVGPAQAYQTYQVAFQRDTLVKTACELAGCDAWLYGWETTVDERTDLGMQQAAYIRQKSGRTFREMRAGDGRTVFRFESRQRCFREHATRPELFLVRHGDWRGNPDGWGRRHVNGRDWVEDFGLHQQQISDEHKRG